jgi:MFS family permease
VPTLLVTSLVGRLPTAMAIPAALLMVRGQGGDYALAGVLASLFTAGTAVGQPVLARIVDGRGQPLILLLSAVMSTAGFVAVAIAGARHPAASSVAALAAGIGTPPLEPCLRASWPTILPEGPLLSAAFSIDVGFQEIVFVVGPLLTVASVTWLGPAGGMIGCAWFGLAGTLGFAVTRTSRGWRPAPPAPGRRGFPVQHGALRRAFAVALGAGVPVGALPIVAAAFAQQHGNSSITGWALAANATGALAAGLYGATRPVRRASTRLMLGASLALALGYLPLGIPVPPAAWLALAALSGMALPVVLSVVFQRVRLTSPASLLTEANAWVVTSFGLGAAMAALVAGLVADKLPADAAIPAVMLGSAVVTAVVCALAYRRDEPDPAR